MNIAIGCDHAGFDYKVKIKEHLETNGFVVKDFGCYSINSVDYPDFAHPVAEKVESGECEFGILLCGSGNGIAMTANKHQGIRAALCWMTEIAILARNHNNANVLVLPARYISLQQALDITDKFFNTPFEGGRHLNRINKISCC